jgi:hypothetical protein
LFLASWKQLSDETVADGGFDNVVNSRYGTVLYIIGLFLTVLGIQISMFLGSGSISQRDPDPDPSHFLIKVLSGLK